MTTIRSTRQAVPKAQPQRAPKQSGVGVIGGRGIYFVPTSPRSRGTPSLKIPTRHSETGHRLAQPPRPFTKASCPSCGAKAINPYCPTCAVR